MRRAIRLARRAEGHTSPNPLVGAVIVKDGAVVGSGYHRKAGQPHAEVNAITDAGRKTQGATLYVTLEPCDHFGRTPPCTDAIIASGIREAVIAMRDPNPLNNGRGLRRLARHGIKVSVGMLEGEARAINKPYSKYITARMPYVTVKIAQSLDGKIATRTGDAKWVSSEESRRFVHRLRGKVDAVMVGAATVIRDDPLLTCRPDGRAAALRHPVRVIVDTYLKTPERARVIRSVGQGSVVIATSKKAPASKIARMRSRGVDMLVVGSSGGRIRMRQLLKMLAERGITHLLVEGGGELIGSLVEARLVDTFLFFIAPKIIGGRDAKTSVEGGGVASMKDCLRLNEMRVTKMQHDIMIEADA